MTKRTYVQNATGKPATNYMKRLFNRGSIRVNLMEVVEAHAANGQDRTLDQVANSVRSSVRMPFGSAVVQTNIDENNIMSIRLSGAPIDIDADSPPRFLAAMLANGNKFSPTVAQSLAASGIKVEVNPQASV